MAGVSEYTVSFAMGTMQAHRYWVNGQGWGGIPLICTWKNEEVWKPCNKHQRNRISIDHGYLSLKHQIWWTCHQIHFEPFLLSVRMDGLDLSGVSMLMHDFLSLNDTIIHNNWDVYNLVLINTIKSHLTITFVYDSDIFTRITTIFSQVNQRILLCMLVLLVCYIMLIFLYFILSNMISSLPWCRGEWRCRG